MATNSISAKPTTDLIGPGGVKKKPRRSKRLMQRTNVTPMEYLRIMEDIYKDLYDNLKVPKPVYDENSKAAADAAMYRQRLVGLVDGEYLKPDSKMSIMTSSLLATVTRAVDGQAIMVIRAARWIAYQEDHLDPHYSSKVADPTIALLFSCLGPNPHQVAANLVVQWQRFHEITHTFGWRYLSLLAFSNTFRQFALKATEQKWVEWLNYADDARLSIEVFGAFYCPEWRETLRRGLGAIDMKLFMAEEVIEEYDGHHHIWGFTIEKDKVVKVEKIVAYEVIEKAILRTGLKGAFGSEDPRDMRIGKDSKFCVVCGRKICDCPSYVWASCLVEVINVGARGYGVRALQTIMPNQTVGEYIGEIVRAGNCLYTPDSYMLRGIPGDERGDPKDNYYVTSKMRGNWTRFVNHGCHGYANCGIDHHVSRGKTYPVYVARRQINMYEELTVDYGQSYWGGSSIRCLCGAKKHYTDKNTYK